MASDIQDELNRIFEVLAGSTTGASGSGVAAAGPDSADGTADNPIRTAPVQVTADAAGPVTGGAAATVEAATAGTFLNSVVGGLSGSVLGTVASSSSGGGTVETVAMDVLKSAFGLVPIVSGLLSLFGGGDSPAPEPLVKYALPSSIDYQAMEVNGGFSGGDYDQMGVPRAYGSGMGATPAPGITVNVQAMDARSFLDRSSDIAAAVKDAMLNLNSINDVVNDL